MGADKKALIEESGDRIKGAFVFHVLVEQRHSLST